MSERLKDLLARIEATTEGSYDLNEAIAEALLGVKVWKSKHGYWNVSFPSDWPYGRTENITMPGRRPDEVYDAATGQKLPAETVPTGWSMDVDLPEFTASMDAALALVERVSPGIAWEIAKQDEGDPEQWFDAIVGHGFAQHRTAPLAILLALLRSTEGGAE
jgi:hypothetical protein